MNKNQISYNKIAQSWNQFRQESPLNSCIIDIARLIKKSGKVLDIGCGTGIPISRFLEKKGFRVTGIDFSSEMIKIARTGVSEHTQLILADFLDYEFQDKFDGIIAFDSLFHLPLEQQKIAIQKVSSLLNKNGYFLFTAGKNEGEINGEMFGSPFSYSSLSIGNLKKELQANDLKIIEFNLDYYDITTGSRDLLVIVQKKNSSLSYFFIRNLD